MKLTREQLAEVKRLRSNLTNKELLDHLVSNFNYKGELTSLRTELYKKGIFKVKMLRWTPKQVKYLLDNLPTMGNTEIAKNLSTKRQTITQKQVEKKMKLLKITRTRDQLDAIRERNRKNGVYKTGNINMWKTRGIAPEGDIKIQVGNGIPRYMIKINGAYTPYARHRYLELHGTITPGHKVYFKDNNPFNISDENLEAQKAGSLKGWQLDEYKKHIAKYFANEKMKTEELAVPKPKAQDPKRDTHQKIPVRLDNRTLIYVQPGTDIAALKKRIADRNYLR
jgi:hypothetical protein